MSPPQGPHRASLAERFPGRGSSPREVEAEDGLGELALLQHALHDRRGAAHRHVGVGHPQDPIEVRVVEGAVGLILTQAELLVIDDDVLNLGRADGRAEGFTQTDSPGWRCPRAGI